jgi:hypothetical protein
MDSASDLDQSCFEGHAAEGLQNVGAVQCGWMAEGGGSSLVGMSDGFVGRAELPGSSVGPADKHLGRDGKSPLVFAEDVRHGAEDAAGPCTLDNRSAGESVDPPGATDPLHVLTLAA